MVKVRVCSILVRFFKLTKYLFSIGSILLILASCQKEANQPSSSTDYRIKEYSVYDDGVFIARYVLDYQNDQLIAVRLFAKNSNQVLAEFHRVLIAYPKPSTGIISVYYLDDTKTWQNSIRYEFEYDETKILSSIRFEFNNEKWVPDQKFMRQFIGDKVLLSTSFEYKQDIFNPVWHELYEYKDEEPEQVISELYMEGNWKSVRKTTLQYDSTLLKGNTEYYSTNDQWFEDVRTDYYYLGDKVAEMKEFKFQDGNWQEKPHSFQFNYDELGNMSSWIEKYEGINRKIEFSYEKGKGNYRQIQDAQLNNWLWYNKYPLLLKMASIPLIENQMFLNQGLNQ
ncbi:MAG: hypothetical protein IPH45_13080 [Bacteroidales bacterium]|nr:hypothetical protein [Bacteroidales bacterium]